MIHWFVITGHASTKVKGARTAACLSSYFERAEVVALIIGYIQTDQVRLKQHRQKRCHRIANSERAWTPPEEC
jgi:hypothetical protein